MKYRQMLIMAQFECHGETMKIMGDIAQQHSVSEPLTIVKQGYIPQLSKENKNQYFNSS
jgi:hypothetical protein